MSDNFVIPISAARHNLIVLGKTRAGKSSKLRVLVEYLLEGGSPVCIIDPKGDWYGLRSAADGKRAGFPIVIFGGEHADVPINEHSGAHVAEIIATGNRPALIDLGGWMVGQRTRFFVDFAATFFKLARGARHLVIDEVHNFAPQGRVMDPDAGKMLHWANRLASEGSGKGITLFAASQRPQKVHKDFVTSCETLIACKVIHKLDRDAIKDWIDGCADPAKGREVIADLAQLKKPEAWAWCPEADYGPERVTFPLFRTYDSFKPQPADLGKLKGWADVDLEDVKAKLASVVRAAEDNDPRMLKKEIVRLKSLLDAKSEPRADEQSWQLAQSEIDQLRQKNAELCKTNTALEQHRDALAAQNTQLREVVGTYESRIDSLETQWNDASEALDKFAHALLTQPTIAPLPHTPPFPTLTKPSAPAPAVRPQAGAHSLRPAASPAPSTSKANGSADLSKGQRAVLTVLVQYRDGVDETQIAILTGYKATTRYQTLKELRAAGYAERHGDIWRATQTGIDALGPVERLPEGRELIDYWMQRLGKGEAKIFEMIVNAHPNAIHKDALADGSGYKETTTYQTLKELRARKLITLDRGRAKAAEGLFE